MDGGYGVGPFFEVTSKRYSATPWSSGIETGTWKSGPTPELILFQDFVPISHLNIYPNRNTVYPRHWQPAAITRLEKLGYGSRVCGSYRQNECARHQTAISEDLREVENQASK